MKNGEIVVRLDGLKREKGYLYYLAKDPKGVECVFRSKMQRGRKAE